MIMERNRIKGHDLSVILDNKRPYFLRDHIESYAICLVDQKGIVRSWSKSAERVSGYTSNEIIGKSFSCFYTSEDCAGGAPGHALATARREGRFSDDGWRVRKDGSRFWASVVIYPIFDEVGNVTAFASIVRNETDRRTYEQVLRRNDERLSLALNAAQAGTFDYDLSNDRVKWSNVSFHIFGLAPTDSAVSIKDWSSVLHPDDREAVLAEMNANLYGERSDFIHDYRIVHPDGGIRWVTSRGHIQRDPCGAPLHAHGINIDVTQRKQMEIDIHAAKAAAERANLAKSKLLAMASHDLRQPLQSLVLFTGVMQARLRGRPEAQGLDKIERGLGTLRDLLDNLLDISRIDAAAVEPRITDFPLRPLLAEIAEAYTPVAGARGLECRTFIDGDPSVRSDRTLLGRIIRNLIENAVRYTERGHIHLIGWCNGADVDIKVCDTGIGIPVDQRQRIFEEFHQVNNPERDLNKGLGLGLAIVQRLSQILHHDITVESVLDQGSVFTVHVQAAPNAPNGDHGTGAGR